MTPEEAISRGHQAESILSSPIYKESLLIIRGKMMDKFQKTSFEQSDERDEIWRQMKIVDQFERQFESVLKTGKLGAGTKKLQDKVI